MCGEIRRRIIITTPRRTITPPKKAKNNKNKQRGLVRGRDKEIERRG